MTRSLWDSKIELGAEFFNEVINRPVPLNMNALAALKRSALGLDFYLWLVYPHLRAPRSAAALLAVTLQPVRSGPEQGGQ